MSISRGHTSIGDSGGSFYFDDDHFSVYGAIRLLRGFFNPSFVKLCRSDASGNICGNHGIMKNTNQKNLAVVIPLKSQKVAKNWAATSRALSATLRSLRRQTSNAFVAVVVGHECPVISEQKGWSFHSLEIEIPELAAGGDYGKRDDFDRILDKNRKIARGVQLLWGSSPTHWFYLDADDVLDVGFVERVLSVPSPVYRGRWIRNRLPKPAADPEFEIV